MTAVLSIDFESRSTVDLTASGAHVYWEHHSTEPLCAHFSIDDSEPVAWVPGDAVPQALEQHIRSGGVVSGWNVSFERLCFEHAMVPHFGWPMPELHQFEDTMAMGAAMSLPRGLDEAAEAIGLSERKDEDGAKVMRELSASTGPVDPAKLKRLLAYNRQDVIVERAMRKTLLALSEQEQELYRLDQVINGRGVKLDLALVDQLQQIATDEQQRLNAAISEVTGGAIWSTNQGKAIIAWLRGQGVATSSLDKASVATMLELGRFWLSDKAKQVLLIRQEAAKSSVGKLKAARACVGKDGRARGLLQFLGADSGRWAGRLLQPQNFPRPSGLVKDVDKALPWLMSGSAAAVDFAYGWPLRAVADSLRGIIVAAPGCDLIAADFSSIESRLLGWAAGETWKIRAYEAEDAGQGHGMYEIVAAQIFGKPIETIGKDSPERQVGKTAELSMGYAGGVTALVKMARNYGVDMAPALPALLASAPAIRIERAERRYADCLKRKDSSADVLTKQSWMACELTKHAWRASNPATEHFWYALAQAALDAVDHPGKQYHARAVTFLSARGVLWQRLPSGRVLAYPYPKGTLIEVPWADKTLPPEQRERRRTVTALWVEGTKLMRRPLYGGLLSAMTIQGSARDLLAAAMLRVEHAGYPICLTVHDEIVAEIPEQFGSLNEFQTLVEQLPPWAVGLPVVSKGYRARRFKKG